ncbi:hypothetical protein [Arcobacter defluvii]|uniref:Replication protein n=1 Tax=Arcobacter defluvii TaxID=873191 RepID=A0AAE7E638_9BACT|nr:hypothetical protein [Arcobacter defluvii]QKF77480.1 hypothetical protein ADFLV_1455 [Arcobacter defluvii]RXI32062.1 hypothetical protein CP964_08765 [Arcobacter defluvii]
MEKKIKFTQISNTCLYDTNLSLDAKGLMCLIKSYPNDWQFYNTHIIKVSNVGKEKLNKLFKQLESNGYITRTKKRDSKGKFRGFEFKICDQGSYKMIPESITKKTPLRQKSIAAKSVATNTNLTNTNLTNTNNSYDVIDNDYQEKMYELNQKLLHKQLNKDILMQKLENLAVSTQNQIDF